ncbi:hypothetical protein MMC10_005899 [Thelotrema lepadinum]|nr:hypothetical protein [Thelotrema lepadinum]
MVHLCFLTLLLSNLLHTILAVASGKENYPAILPWVAQHQANQYTDSMKDWHGQMKTMDSLNPLTQGKETGEAIIKSSEAFHQAKQAYQAHKDIAKTGMNGVGYVKSWKLPEIPIHDPLPPLKLSITKQRAPKRILGFPDHHIPKQGIPGYGIPIRKFPGHGALKQVISKQVVPMHAVAMYNAPVPVMYGVQGSPAQLHPVPHQNFPGQGIPAHRTPMQKVQMQGVPWQGMRTQSLDNIVSPNLWNPEHSALKQYNLRQSTRSSRGGYSKQSFTPPELAPSKSGHNSQRIDLYDKGGSHKVFHTQASSRSGKHGGTQQGSKTF